MDRGEKGGRDVDHVDFLEFGDSGGRIGQRRMINEHALIEAVQRVLRGFPVKDREDFVVRSLAELGRAAGVSRAYVFENSLDEEGEVLTSQRYEWCKPGVEPQIDNPELQSLPLEAAGMGRWLRQFEEGRPVVGLVDQFPEEEREILQSQSILSLAVVPVFIDSTLWGFVGFDDVEQLREWSEVESSALLAAASAIGHEISRKRAEVVLLRTQRLEAVGSIAGGLAHDFNNMLCIVLGYGQLLRAGLSEQEPKLLHAVDQILEAAERSTMITRQLLDFARKQLIEPRVVDLGRVLSGLEELLRSLGGESVELVYKLTQEPMRVWIDPGQLEQLVANFAANARDAMPRGGRIVIETSPVRFDNKASEPPGLGPGEFAHLRVSDTGLGMPPEVVARVFEPFFTTKGAGEGTGLGLASALGIVERAGGAIQVHSEVGRGTTFDVFLPRISADPRHEALDGADESMPVGTETILLVEDQPQLRVLLAAKLNDCGYDVTACSGLEEVQEHLQTSEQAVDLVFTDVVLGRGDGGEVFELVRSIHPEARVLFMSGYADSDIFDRGVIKAGFQFIPKPLTPAQAARRVRRVLDGEDVPSGGGDGPSSS